MISNTHFSVPGTDHLQSIGWMTLFYPISIVPKIFLKDFSNLKHLKNLKSINNSTSSNLFSYFLINRPVTMKELEKHVFSKILALGNLKFNKSNNLKSRQFSWKNTWGKATALKVNLFRKISILINLRVNSLDSPEITRTTIQQTHLLDKTVFYK